MKQIYIVIISFVISLTAFSQADSVLKGKLGIPILPKAGDIGLGTSADPFLEYLGNMFNNTDDNYLNLGSSTIYGKYYLTDNSAVRLSLRVNCYTNRYNYYVRDDAAYFADNLSQAQVIDEQMTKNKSFNVGLSYYKYRGYGRLQGFYGPNVNYSYNRTVNEYTFGNPITALNPMPTSYYGYFNGDSRRLYTDSGNNHSISAGFSAGVEYFFVPKISIGGEVGIYYYYSFGSQNDTKYEKWDGGAVYEYTQPNSPGNTYSNLYTYQFDTFGTLFLMFHF